MSDNIISLEDHPGTNPKDLKKLLLLISPDQRDDVELQRLMLFRMKLDGFDRTRSYLVEKLRDAEACGFKGRLFDYLKNDTEEKACKS